MQIISEFRGEYFYLSNFYPANISYMWLDYKNAEAAFQAQKCSNIGERTQFCNLTGTDARRLGRHVSIIPMWEDVKVNVMESVVRNKFLQNYDLCEKLLSTGNALLVEENNWGDEFWGVNKKTGVGRNHLGKILMKIRKELELRSVEKPAIRARGLAMDSGKLVYGNALQLDDGEIRIASSTVRSNIDSDMLEMVAARRIVPGTLSFFTGFSDKYGTEIFSRDIITCPKRGANFYGAVIAWDTQYCKFVVLSNGIKFPLFYWKNEVIVPNDYEVIGNTILNPELAFG